VKRYRFGRQRKAHQHEHVVPVEFTVPLIGSCTGTNAAGILSLRLPRPPPRRDMRARRPADRSTFPIRQAPAPSTSTWADAAAHVRAQSSRAPANAKTDAAPLGARTAQYAFTLPRDAGRHHDVPLRMTYR